MGGGGLPRLPVASPRPIKAEKEIFLKKQGSNGRLLAKAGGGGMGIVTVT